MSKQMKKTIFGILGGIVLMLLIAYLPPETEMMSRQGWQYLGCFGFLLTCLISGALPDWVATLATMVMLLVFKLGKVADVTVEFSGTTVWLCIGVFIMSVGINNSGFMKRLALWVLTKFPGTYRGQVTAMMLAGIITTPMIPSSYAKTSIMAPLIGQVCEAVGAEPNSKAARGLWFANFMGTYILGIAFMSGSAFVALMIGFMQGLAFTWGSWLKCTIVWYLVLIVLTYLYCTIICKPKEKLAGDVTFLKEQYKALGAVSKKEKQGIIIVAIAIILWIVFNFLLSKTRTGRYIYATGSNIDAARLSGVNVVSTTVIAYVVSAFCSFVVGIITCATVGQGTMDAGNSYEMYAVAASVIGGVSTLGGQGILLGTVVGAAIWGTLQNGLQFAGAPVAIRNIIIGIIVVLSVLMDVVIRTGRRNTKVSD